MRISDWSSDVCSSDLAEKQDGTGSEEIMSNTRYTEQHEWIAVDGNIGTVGITAFAQEQLGDIVFVELPEDGNSVNQGDQVAALESVKAAAEIYAPVGGVVTDTNDTLVEDPAKLKPAPEGEDRFFKLTVPTPPGLPASLDEPGHWN